MDGEGREEDGEEKKISLELYYDEEVNGQQKEAAAAGGVNGTSARTPPSLSNH